MKMRTAIIICVACLICGVFIIGSAIDTGKQRQSISSSETYIEKFAEDHNIPLELAQSMDDAIQQISDKFDRSFTLKQAYNFEQVEDWANGKRYHIYLDYEYVLYIYEQDNEVVSIRRSNGDFVYQK